MYDVDDINGNDTVIPSSSLSRRLDFYSLKTELDCLAAYLRVYNAEQPIPVKRATRGSTICDVINHKPYYKISLRNLDNSLGLDTIHLIQRVC